MKSKWGSPDYDYELVNPNDPNDSTQNPLFINNKAPQPSLTKDSRQRHATNTTDDGGVAAQEEYFRSLKPTRKKWNKYSMCFMILVILATVAVAAFLIPGDANQTDSPSDFVFDSIFNTTPTVPQVKWCSTALGDAFLYSSSRRQNKLVLNQFLSAEDKFNATFTLQTEEYGELSSFSLSPQGDLLLLGFNTTTTNYDLTPISTYIIYNMTDNTQYLLSKVIKHPISSLQNAIWSTYTGSPIISYVVDGKVSLVDLSTSKIKSVVSDGNGFGVISGIMPWIYSTELFDGDNNALWWSPQGGKLAILQSNQTSVPTSTIQYYLSSPYSDNIILHYPKAGFPNPRTTLLVYDRHNESIISINATDEYITGVAWASEDVVVVRLLNRLQNKRTFVACETIDGNCTLLNVYTSTTWVTGNIPLTLIKDGSERQYIVDLQDNNGFNHIALISLNVTEGSLPSKPYFVTGGDWEVTDFVGYSPLDLQFYYISTEISPMERQLFSIDFGGATKTLLTTNSGWYDATMSASGSWLTVSFSGNLSTVPTTSIRSVTSNLEMTLEENSDLQLTVNSFALPLTQFFNFSINGTLLNGLMLFPPSFQDYKQYPAILQVYGSPGTQLAINSFNLGINTYLASKGSIVVMVDGHGTGGRGNEFQTLVYKQLGTMEVAEQLAAITYLQTLKFVNPNLITMWGWGYGGFVTALAMATPKKDGEGGNNFVAGACIAPITDWTFYDSIFAERFMQTPEVNPLGYANASVLTKATQFARDFLLVHGTADPIIHLQHSAELSRILVSRKFQFSEQFYTNANDAFWGSEVLDQMYSKLTTFLLDEVHLIA